MSRTTKHRINSKFKAGLIELKNIPINIRKQWNRRNGDKGEARSRRNEYFAKIKKDEIFVNNSN